MSKQSWPAVGDVVIVRRLTMFGRIDHEHRAVVQRRTPARVYTDHLTFRLVNGRWYMTPRYLNYDTTLVPDEQPNDAPEGATA